jgi:O-antigen/teichoic acid export membrane protein
LKENSTIIKNSLILYLRLIVVSIVGLLSSRFILQALGASDFGLYNLVGGIVFLMAIFNNVMVSTTYRFIAFELGKEENAEVNRVFNVSLMIHVGLAFLVVLIAETIGVYYIKNYLVVSADKIEDALFVFHLSIASTFVSIISVPHQGLISANEKFWINAIAEILRSILALTAVLIVFNFDGNRIRLYSLLISIVTLIPSIVFILYSYYKFPNITKWNFQSKLKYYREMFQFSIWIMFGACASAAEVQISSMIINRFFGTLLNASYGVANQVNTMVKMFSQSLNQATIPQITKSFSGGDTNKTLNLVIFSSKYSFILMLIPSLPILLETDFVLNLWLQNAPANTVIFVQLMILNALITTMSAGIPAAVHATGKIKYFQIILSTIVLLGLPVAYFLFKLGYPAYTILVIHTVISLVNMVMRQYLLKKLINFNVREFISRAYFRMIYVLAFVSPLFIIHYIFPTSTVRFISVSVFSIFWLLIGVYFTAMENSERIIAKQFIKKIFNAN